MALTLAVIHPAAAQQTRVTIENDTGVVLRGVYATPVRDDNWRLDRLNDIVQIGSKAVIQLPARRCHYDFRVLLESRPEEILFMNIDICRSPVLKAGAKSGRRVSRGLL